jgi:membrane protein
LKVIFYKYYYFEYNIRIIENEGVYIVSMKQFISDIRNLIFRFRDDDIPALGAQLAYSLLLAFFPFLIFLMTVIAYSSIKSETILLSLQAILPSEVFILIKNTVVEVVDSKYGHLLSVSLIFTVLAASNGFKAVIKGLNKAYDEQEERGFFKIQLISILCTFALAFVILATFTLLVFGNILGNYFTVRFGYSRVFKDLWDLIRYVFTLLDMIFVFSALYRYTPCRRMSWLEVLPGALFSTLGWLVVSIGFSYYVDNFARYSKIYGSIGAVIILMTWLFLSSVIIILGGELNATLAFDRQGREKPKCKKYS